MSRPLRSEHPGTFYNVTSRGNDQKDIFKSRKDEEKAHFIPGIRHGKVRRSYSCACCLISNNHYFPLETPRSKVPLIIKHINRPYTTYCNVKQKRDQSGVT